MTFIFATILGTQKSIYNSYVTKLHKFLYFFMEAANKTRYFYGLPFFILTVGTKNLNFWPFYDMISKIGRNTLKIMFVNFLK